MIININRIRIRNRITIIIRIRIGIRIRNIIRIYFDSYSILHVQTGAQYSESISVHSAVSGSSGSKQTLNISIADRGLFKEQHTSKIVVHFPEMSKQPINICQDRTPLLATVASCISLHCTGIQCLQYTALQCSSVHCIVVR